MTRMGFIVTLTVLLASACTDTASGKSDAGAKLVPPSRVASVNSVNPDCSSAPVQHPISKAFGPAFGSSPVWGVGLDREGRANLDGSRWKKILWVVRADFVKPITVSANSSSGSFARISIDNRQEGTSPVLRPHRSSVWRGGRADPRYLEFRSLLHLTPGCWGIAARWVGGHWTVSVRVTP